MTTASAFRVALFVVGVAVPLLMLCIVATKGWREIRSQREAKLVRAVRPVVLAAIESSDARTEAVELTGRRRAVAESLAIALLPQLRGADRNGLAQLLVVTGMVDRAVSGLGSRWAPRRQRAAEMLGAAGHRPATSALIRRLDDRDIEVRIAAARALGRIGDAVAVEPLVRALDTGRVPANAASMAILRIGTSGAPALRAAMLSDVARTRATVAELAGSLGLMSLRGAIEQLLDDPSPLVRVGAVRSIGRLASPGSVPLLNERLDLAIADDDGTRRGEVIAMIAALGHIGERSCIPLLERSLSGHPRVAAAAAAALASMGQRRSPNSVETRAAETASSEPSRSAVPPEEASPTAEPGRAGAATSVDSPDLAEVP